MSDLHNDEISKTWANANFGPQGETPEGRMSLIVKSLGGIARGFSSGSTMTAICSELNLLKGDHLSDRGLHWLCTFTKADKARIEELEDQIKAAREVLTDYSIHNPTLERVLVEARLKLKVKDSRPQESES